MSGNWHHIGNISGRDGIGVPQGGAQGEALVKEGGSDYAAAWRKLNFEDIEGMVPAAALPQISNEPYVVNSQSAMLNLPAVPGRMAIRTDQGKTYVLSELPASTLANWVELTTTSDVQSVNGKTGNVTLNKADIGLSNVNNTADADKPQATTSTPGLMPAADKTKLNNATASPTANRMVIRDANGRTSFRQLTLSDAPSSSGQAATKAYVDDEVNRLTAGRVPLNTSTLATNWDSLGSTSQAGVVEGFPIGAPAGIAGSAGEGFERPSDHFVLDPVWEIKHESLGLGYRKQTAKLLSSDPAYMVGFTWERYYNPATSKWADWKCVAGDTGVIESFGGERTREDVFHHRSNTYLYTTGQPHEFQRIGGWCYADGSATMPPAELSANGGGRLGWLSNQAQWPIQRIWAPDTVRGPMAVSQGSGTNRWHILWKNPGMVDLYADRYGPGDPSSNVWLPFSLSWPAPRVRTWQGYGLITG